MDARIVMDAIERIVYGKVQALIDKGIIVANYDELLARLQQMGYTEQEVREAIVTLVRTKQAKAGKFSDGRGWIRDFRQIDRE